MLADEKASLRPLIIPDCFLLSRINNAMLISRPSRSGSFTTPAGASITGSVQSTAMASHSGITVYNSVIQPFSANGKISTSQAQNPVSRLLSRVNMMIQ